MNRHISHGLTMLGAVAALCMTSSPDASAQPWFQSVYGAAKTEVGRSVLQSSNDGGYITAGYSNSFSAQYDVYIVKTTNTGALQWSQVFDIGGDDYGTSIAEVPGGYIITGYTQNIRGCCSKDDLFIMKIDANGVHQWTKLYGGNAEDQGHEIRTTIDDGLIIAGWTQSYGQGNREGFLFKTDLNGNVIWAKVFGGTLSDYFHSVTLTSDQGYAAAGTSQSFLQPGRTDAQAWVVKVDVNGNLLWSRVYGGLSDDGARSIREVNPTDLVFVGNTNSTGAGSSDILLVKTTPLGVVLGARTFGTSQYDEGLSVKEVQNTPGHLGNYILTGFEYNAAGGFGSGDVYFAEVQPNAALTPVSRRWMGGTGDDWGWAINEDRFAVPGIDYIIAGRTTSAFLLPEDEYLLTVNPAAVRTCQERVATDQTFTVSVASTSVNPVTTNAIFTCTVQPLTIQHTTSQADPCPPSLSAPAPMGDDGGTSGIDRDPWQESDRPSISLNAGNLLNSYPNPVKRGSTFQLEYLTMPDARATITVMDVAGQVVHTESNRSMAGLGRVPVTTEGWANGVYMVQVVVGDTKMTRQIVVMDK